MTDGTAFRLLVVAADPRIRAAVAGFMEPAGHCVDGIHGSAAGDPAAVLAAAWAADLALVDWSLAGGQAGHLGLLLRQARPELGLVALVPMGTDRPEPAGWDMVAPLPLAGDTMARIVDRWQEGRDGRD